MGANRIGHATAGVVGVAVLALAVVVPASVAGAHGIIDQESGSCLENLIVDDSGDPPITEVAQTFVPSAGVLLGLDIQMEHYSGSSLSIRTGGPDGAVVGTGSFEANSSMGWVHVDLDEPVVVTPGETYGFRFSNDGVFCANGAYAAGSFNACSDACEPASAYDLTFRTFTNSAPPDTTIDSGPEDGTSESTAVFEFSGTDDVTPVGDLTFECSVDGGAFEACESGEDFGPFVPGPHALAVRAVDGEGQIDPTPAEYTWRVTPDDPVAPPGESETSTTTTTTTTVVPGRVAARAAAPTRAQPTFAG